MSNYSLEAYIPYERPESLYDGDEQGLRDFIAANKGQKVHRTVTGKEWPYITVAGHALDDLTVSIILDINDFI